jgi:hypothetical protein
MSDNTRSHLASLYSSLSLAIEHEDASECPCLGIIERALDLRQQIFAAQNHARVQTYVAALKNDLSLRRKDFPDALDATVAMHLVHGSPIGWAEFYTRRNPGRSQSIAAARTAPVAEFVERGDEMPRHRAAVLQTLQDSTQPLNRDGVWRACKEQTTRPPNKADVTYALHSLWNSGQVVPVNAVGKGVREMQCWRIL